MVDPPKVKILLNVQSDFLQLPPLEWIPVQCLLDTCRRRKNPELFFIHLVIFEIHQKHVNHTISLINHQGDALWCILKNT